MKRSLGEADLHGKSGQAVVFSIGHLNSRSRKKNLGNLDTLLNIIDYNFSLVGLSETWLQNCTCDLYNLEAYEFIETSATPGFACR